MSNLTFTVQLDCTERLEKVLQGIAESLSSIQTLQPTMVVTPTTEVSPVEPKPIKQEEQKVEEPQAVMPEPETEKQTEVQESQAEAAEITDSDLRDVMRDTRARVLGNNINDAILKKVLNDKLREKVASYGCNASTDMNQEQRREFVAFCAAIPVMEVSEDAPY